MSETLRSEDELGRKWDRCITDTSIKFGIHIFCFRWAAVLCVRIRDYNCEQSTLYGVYFRCCHRQPM